LRRHTARPRPQGGLEAVRVYRLRGQRFHGAGWARRPKASGSIFTARTAITTASGMDGLEIHIHGNAQDQVAQIAKCGKLVIHGDVGQTFMYGPRAGEVYVLGNAAAGR